MDSANHENECESSEEMKAAFEVFNELEENIRMKCQIVSMDVKALYPSMQWKEIIRTVREMIESSNMVIKNVNWHELGKYLAVMMTEEEIETEGLRNAVPKRKNPNTRSITINYLQDDKNDDKWYRGRKPGRVQQRRMISLAVTIGIYQVMSQHTYKVGDVCYLQMEGGPIGLELTGAVSRAFMMSWDRKYLEMVRKAGLKMRMYQRYIDDSNQAADVPQPGSKYDKDTVRLYLMKMS